MTKEDALRKAVTKGHKIGRWKDLGVWQFAECKRCECWVAVNTKGEIAGGAIQVECGKDKP